MLLESEGSRMFTLHFIFALTEEGSKDNDGWDLSTYSKQIRREKKECKAKSCIQVCFSREVTETI